MVNNSEDDKLATLDDALAFLGWCDSKISTGPSDEQHILGDIDDLIDGTVKGAAVILPASLWELKLGETGSMSPPKKKPRFRSASSSSTALQRRKRAEIQTLREELAELRGYLKQLKIGGGHSLQHWLDGMRTNAEEGGGGLLMWHQRALTAYRERLQSDQTNRRLKEILYHQQKVYNKLNGILQRQNVLYGHEFVEKINSSCSQGISVDHINLLVSQLEGQAELFYRDFNATFGPQEKPILNCTSQPKYDEQIKSHIIEFVTTTPLDCSSEDVCSGIWNTIQKYSKPGGNADSRKANANIALQHRNCVLHVDWIHYVQKFMEKDRIVITWSDVVLLPTQKLQYRTRGYTTITPTEATSSSGCVIRTKVKLYRERGDDLLSETANDAHHTALGALSIKMRRFWQAEQNRLMRDHF